MSQRNQRCLHAGQAAALVVQGSQTAEGFCPLLPPGEIRTGRRQARSLSARRAVGEDRDQRGRIAVRQRCEKDRVHHTEDRGVGPDAKGKNQDRHAGERRALSEGSEGNPDVGGEHRGRLNRARAVPLQLVVMWGFASSVWSKLTPRCSLSNEPGTAVQLRC